MREGKRRSRPGVLAPPRPAHGPGSSLDHVAAYFGQAFSMLLTVVLVSCPVIHCVACFQNASEPTAAGIWSEPSNRNTVFGSCRSVPDSRSIGLVRLFRSRPLLALTQPEESLALMFA